MKMTGARDSDYLFRDAEFQEVGKLKGSHTDGGFYRYIEACISFRYISLILLVYESKVKLLGLLVFGIIDVKKGNIIAIPHIKAFGISSCYQRS
jgi:hypothetical protein